MLYLILFYWIFAALFCYGAVSLDAEEEGRSIPIVFMGCLLIGGILLPIYLGRSLNF
jgi:hypothetical protein